MTSSIAPATDNPSADHCGEIALIGVEFPKALMPLPLDKVDRLVNRRLPGREGMGALLASFLTCLTQHRRPGPDLTTPSAPVADHDNAGPSRFAFRTHCH
ncbi:hypothetical protein [Streptomyces sp. NPDC050804]|uniref:hypothetical protein n=1 Tax=Streptomyces sp. NPDC050804 TaxID=3154745 RepID=UPI003433E23F